MQAMMALSIWQPWATLLAAQIKLYETRGWATGYRGPIAIHAAISTEGTKLLNYGEKLSIENLLYCAEIQPCAIDDLPRGCIIATAELVGVHKIGAWLDTRAPMIMVAAGDGSSPVKTGQAYTPCKLDRQELWLGDYSPGRYAWEFANMRMLPQPIPAKGKQGLWIWNGAA